ncbi:MAG: 3-dehydroquinate synthase [Myxococcota bacterium]|nr:3-dehydroquinate synthase [Myxococcota bacterium]
MAGLATGKGSGGSEPEASGAEVVWVRPEGIEPYRVAVATDPGRALAAAIDTPPAGGLLFVGDSAVEVLHGAAVRRAFGAPDAPWLTFPPGEASKTRKTVARLQDEALAAGIDRDTTVVAVGGGVSTDIGGFVAATLLRGLRWIAAPTTLLGAVDAAIGGKTGVDTPVGKNLIGTFHHPAAVLAATDLPATLPPRERLTGWAEVIKHGVVADRDLFDWLDRLVAARAGDLAAWWDPDAAVRPVARSVAVKAAVVSEDPFERGRRAILNFGHTVGHALEAAAAWSISHGEAVAVGMVCEARMAADIGVLAEDDRERIVDLVAAAGLPVRTPAFRAADVMDAMRSDKKRRAGELRFALPTAIGEVRRTSGAYTRPVPEQVVQRALVEAGCSA